MLIYKIFRQSEWEALLAQGETAGAPVDLADGYIHFSTAQTVRETAAKYFAGMDDLILAWVESDTLGTALKWEKSRGGIDFPHLYHALRLEEVADHAPLPSTAGGHDFPVEVA